MKKAIIAAVCALSLISCHNQEKTSTVMPEEDGAGFVLMGTEFSVLLIANH